MVPHLGFLYSTTVFLFCPSNLTGYTDKQPYLIQINPRKMMEDLGDLIMCIFYLNFLYQPTPELQLDDELDRPYHSSCYKLCDSVNEIVHLIFLEKRNLLSLVRYIAYFIFPVVSIYVWLFQMGSYL